MSKVNSYFFELIQVSIIVAITLKTKLELEIEEISAIIIKPEVVTEVKLICL